MIAFFNRLMTDQKGQDLIEYALLGGFVSLAAVAGATLLGISLNDWYTAVAGRVGGLNPGGQSSALTAGRVRVSLPGSQCP